MPSLNQGVLLGLLADLSVAKSKRKILEESGLDTDKIEARIEVLETMIEQQRELMENEM